MNRTRVLLLLSTLIFLTSTAIVYAAGGVVPCDGPDCRACDIITLGQNLLTWFIGIMAAIIALMFAWGGMEMVMSAGNASMVSSGREKMSNAVIGLIIVLSAWLIVNTVILVISGGNLSNWGQIQCVDNPSRITHAPAVVVGGTSSTGGTTGGTAFNTAQIVQKYGSQIDTYCKNSTIPNCSVVVSALIAAESSPSGNTMAVSPAGALGLMQLTPSNGGATCQSNDTTCINGQIEKGIQMLESSYRSTGSIPLTLIQYNGGAAATAPSNCCPSGMAYECPYDCQKKTNYNQCTGPSDICVANTGFTETRNYVKNICATIGGCE